MKILASKPYRYAELVIMMLGVPAAIYQFELIRYMLPTLWVLALYCYLIHRATTKKRWRDDWNGADLNRAHLKPILTRFVLCAIFLSAATGLLMPEKLFSFPRERTGLWALIMVAYPVLSVMPQEIIFRLHFFERYKDIFKTRELMIIASGLSFGLAHIIFQNWVAPLLCAVGGILFSMTYAKNRALSLVAVEHALYGDFIFTIGLGYYFYHGTVAAAAQAVGQ